MSFWNWMFSIYINQQYVYWKLSFIKTFYLGLLWFHNPGYKFKKLTQDEWILVSQNLWWHDRGNPHHVMRMRNAFRIACRGH